MITTHNNFCRFTPSEQQEECSILRGYMELARDFDTSIIRVLAGNWDRTWQEISRNKAITATVETIKKCLKYAYKYNITLAIENHPGMGVDKDIIQEIFEKVDSLNFGWNFDMENASCREGQDAFDFLNEELILKRLVYVHVKNYKESPDGWVSSVAVDEGVLDIKAMLKKVKDSGYDGWLSVEYGGKNIEDVRKSVNFIRRNWPNL